MNILFLTQKLSGGGAERVIALLASEFAIDNNVFVATHRDDEAYPISDKVNIICLDLNKSENTISRIKNCVIAVAKLRRIKRDKKIDVTVSMLNSPNFENVISRVNDKIIISIRNLTSAQLSGVKAKMSCFSGKHADWTVSLSENVKRDQIRNFKTPPEKIITIYNPCNYEFIAEQGKKETYDQTFDMLRKNADCMVITAGRCTYQKGQWHMIRAFKKVVEKNPKAILIILGCGDMDDFLNKLILEMQLEKNVFKVGFKKNIYSYLAKADIFVFSSIYEGFGNVLLEAMACGLPIISCDCVAGPRELLAPSSPLEKRALGIECSEFGILTPPMDGNIYEAKASLSSSEEIFAEAINILACDTMLRNKYKEKSLERIRDFSTEKILQQWKEIMK